jgi:hypothetical protein
MNFVTRCRRLKCFILTLDSNLAASAFSIRCRYVGILRVPDPRGGEPNSYLSYQCHIRSPWGRRSCSRLAWARAFSKPGRSKWPGRGSCLLRPPMSPIKVKPARCFDRFPPRRQLRALDPEGWNPARIVVVVEPFIGREPAATTQSDDCAPPKNGLNGDVDPLRDLTVTP